jgi:hypothetical protein
VGRVSKSQLAQENRISVRENGVCDGEILARVQDSLRDVKEGSLAKGAWQTADQVTRCGMNNYAAQGDVMLRDTLSGAKAVQRSNMFNQNFCKYELITKRTKMVSLLGHGPFRTRFCILSIRA